MTSTVTLSIDDRRPFAAGARFGSVGAYERLSGQAVIAVDPHDKAYREIADLDRAPLNRSGRVECTARFLILRPVDPLRGNRALLYEVVNRGNIRVLDIFNGAYSPAQSGAGDAGSHYLIATRDATNNPSTMKDAGNGFLMRYGYTLVWSGWQGDVGPGNDRFTLDVPPVGDTADAGGFVRTELMTEDSGVHSLPLSAWAGRRGYPPADPKRGNAILTVRPYERSAPTVVPPDEWSFVRTTWDSEKSEYSVNESPHDVFLRDGFRPAWIYELIYLAREPRILGLGFAAVREFLNFLRYELEDAAGTQNPLLEHGARPERAYAYGRSQSGRFLREWVYRGFNSAADGRKIFDGVFCEVAGAGNLQPLVEQRFAQPDRVACQHENHLYPTDRFPFSYARTCDPFTGRTDSILQGHPTDPLIIHTQSSADYWSRRGSLVHTDTEGNDLDQPDTVRIYAYASGQHVVLRGGLPEVGAGQAPTNPLNTRALSRALLCALDRWVRTGVLPPPSRVPLRGEGTLVTVDAVRGRFPRIPGVAFPAKANRLEYVDYGPRFCHEWTRPESPRPVPGQEYTVLVPQVDADGNDEAGIRTPEIQVPIATYTGWNLRHREGMGAGTLWLVHGSFLPFAQDAAERAAKRDPRRSIDERYPSRTYYLAAVSKSVERLLDRGFLLEEDADPYVEAAMCSALFGRL